MSVLRQRIFGLGEGVTIALDSIRANKVRAGLTILGIAVGVFVVVVISAAIHGINASVAKDLESTGPTTFFVSRFPITFEACDGTEDTCKFFRNPRLTLDDAETIGRLPTIRIAGARLDTQRPAAYKDRRQQDALEQFVRAIAADPTNYEALWKASRSEIDLAEISGRPALDTLLSAGQQHAGRWAIGRSIPTTDRVGADRADDPAALSVAHGNVLQRRDRRAGRNRVAFAKHGGSDLSKRRRRGEQNRSNSRGTNTRTTQRRDVQHCNFS
jgi:hypothetical protein